MTRLLLALSVASLLVAACATTGTEPTGPQAKATIIEEGPPPPKKLERLGFTAQIPTGWEEIVNEQVKKATGEHGAAIKKPEIMAVPNYNSANIVIRTVTNMDLDPKDPAACEKTAAAIAKVQQSTVDSATIITIPSGETCQMSLSGLPESQGSTDRKTKATILAAPNNNYVFTCYYDGRDASAAKACDDTLSSFAFKEVAPPPTEEPTAGTDGGTATGTTDGGTSGMGTMGTTAPDGGN